MSAGGAYPKVDFSHADALVADVAAGGAHSAISQEYRLLEKIGEGGMGTVWRAVHRPTQRCVAVKMMTSIAFGSDRGRMRFEREIELSARLDHPGIVRVYDAGCQGGVYFLAMELVDGVPLDHFVRGRTLTPSQSATLVLKVCRAVQHAHQRGVIHRDLKPANILIRTADEEPRVVDFGLARDLFETEEAITITREGAAAGTLAYMAPEQAAGQSRYADTRSDVYALGVILYHLLTGRHPHDLTGSSIEVARRIVTEDIRRPRQVRRDLPVDLEVIVLKALARDPARRYFSAGELAEDLDRYLCGRPIVARPPTLSYLLRQWVRRHWIGLATASAVLIAIVSVSIAAYVRVSEAYRQSQAQLARSHISEADVLATSQRWKEAKAKYLEARAVLKELGEPAEKCNLALWTALRDSPAPLVEHNVGKGVRAAAAMRDGRHIAVAVERLVRVLDLATGHIRATLEGHADTVRALSVSPDGKLIVSGSADGELIVWNAADGKLLRRWKGHMGPVLTLSWQGGEQGGAPVMRIISGGEDHRVAWWSAETGERLDGRTIAEKPVEQLAVAGMQGLVTVAKDDRIELRSRDGLVLTRELRSIGGGSVIAASPDGRWAAANFGRFIDVWEITNGFIKHTLNGFAASPTVISFSDDGAYLVAASLDTTVQLWCVGESAPVHCFTDLESPAVAVGFLPGEPIAFALTEGGVVRAWRVDACRNAFGFRPLHMNDSVFSADGSLLLVVQDGAFVPELWDVMAGQPLRQFDIRSLEVRSIALSPVGHRAAMGTFDGRVLIWNLSSPKAKHTWTVAGGPIQSVAFSSNGKHLAYCFDNQVIIHDVDNPEMRRELAPSPSVVSRVRFSPRGDLLLAGCEDGTLRAWTTAEASSPQCFVGHTGSVNDVAVSHNGKTMVSVGADRMVCFWDIESGRLERMLSGHASPITTVTMDSDGRYAATGDANNVVRIWDVPAFKEIRAIEHDGGGLQSIHLRSQLKELRVAGKERVGIWHVALAQDYPVALDNLSTLLRCNDAHAIKALGDYYLNRGARKWGLEMLRMARDQGADVSALELARASWYWRTEQPDEAYRYFREAQSRREGDHVSLEMAVQQLSPGTAK